MSPLLGWLLLAVAAMWTANCAFYISKIGKAREPIKATSAAFDTLVNAGMIVVIVIAALQNLT